MKYAVATKTLCFKNMGNFICFNKNARVFILGMTFHDVTDHNVLQ